MPRGSCADESTIDDNARIALDGLTATVISSNARSMLEYGLIRKVADGQQVDCAILCDVGGRVVSAVARLEIGDG